MLKEKTEVAAMFMIGDSILDDARLKSFCYTVHTVPAASTSTNTSTLLIL
jgi:hypothetical protein